MSQIQYIPEVDETFTQTTDRGHFGKMKVLINNKLCAITIGPDCNVCQYLDCFFIPAFSFFLICGVLVTMMVFKSSQNYAFRLATVFICIGQPLSYLTVALSNPGIISRSIIQIPVQQVSSLDALEFIQQPVPKSKKHKYCKKCNIYTKPTTFHCGDCQLCVEQYDHHCPWVSKCIGKNNLVKFYIFLTMTPVFMVYSFISFFACTAIDLVEKTSQVQNIN